MRGGGRGVGCSERGDDGSSFPDGVRVCDGVLGTYLSDGLDYDMRMQCEHERVCSD